MSIPEVRNVKFRFRVGQVIVLPSHIDTFTASGSNFYTVALDNYRFTIFPKKGDVNITGVRNFEEIPVAIVEFEQLFKISVPKTTVIIDNSTASGQMSFCGNINLYSIANILRKEKDNHKRQLNPCKVSVRPETLPCAIIRRKKKSTINIFQSGKYTIVGGKSLYDIEEAYDIICIIKDAMANEEVSLDTIIEDALEAWGI